MIKENKIINLPIIKQIYNKIESIKEQKYTQELIDVHKIWISEKETDEMLYIWGILSADNLSNSTEANFWTMNDLDLIYHKDTNKYFISVETIYEFLTPEAKYNYMKNLLDQFTNWMNGNNYNTKKELDLYEVFTEGIDLNTQFNSIEDAYIAFKLIVNGYCSLQF